MVVSVANEGSAIVWRFRLSCGRRLGSFRGMSICIDMVPCLLYVERVLALAASSGVGVPRRIECARRMQVMADHSRLLPQTGKQKCDV